MPANSHGIIVEGEYDSVFYEEIIRKLASHPVNVFPVRCGGRANLLKSLRGFLEVLRHRVSGAPVDMAIVIADADGRDPTAVEEQMRAKIQGREYPFDVRFHAVQHAMEAWLLADGEALRRVVRGRTGKDAGRPHPNPESLLDPKPSLRALLEEGKVTYTPVVAAEIAREIDFQVLSQRCPRFRLLANLVDC